MPTETEDVPHPDRSGQPHDEPGSEPGGEPYGLLRLGRAAWALLGLAILLGGLLYLAGQIMLLVVPLVLALFPAALLEPVSRWLKEHRVPPALASLLTIIGSIALLVGLIAALVPLVLADLPQLIEAGEQGFEQLQTFLEEDPWGLGLGTFEELLREGQQFIGEVGEIAGQALEALATAFEAATAVVFMLVALFFYLKDDRRISRGIGDLLPPSVREHGSEIGSRVWNTLGGFFRGQLLVALVDALFIGLGLVILGVPLALPLSVLIFFGGLFPIIGAFLTGTLAVLVALADGGLIAGIIVFALVLGVQQLESNVLEPLVLGKVISLHPLMIIVAVTAGALTLGVLGAFLAVPIVASIARAVEYLREQRLLDTSEERSDRAEAGPREPPDEAASEEPDEGQDARDDSDGGRRQERRQRAGARSARKD